MTLFSIGYGNRSIDTFVRLLEANNVRYLVDVRSKPYSRNDWNKSYNQPTLKDELLKRSNITYVFMGDLLGGRPDVPSVYSEDGKVEYEKVKQLNSFKFGIERLRRAAELTENTAIMCSEQDPSQCHRSKLIGVVLEELGIQLVHIDTNGELVSQDTVMLRVKSRQNRVPDAQMSLFSDELIETSLTSNKSYRRPVDQYAYIDDDDELSDHGSSYD